MEKLNQELILKLRDGKISVSNNGTKEQLIEVVKAACPNDIDCKAAGNKYYTVEEGLWGGYSQTDLPIVSIHDFYTTPSYEELLRQNREMKEALENTLDELYRLGEHCADQKFIDFEDESIDGVNSYNRIMKQGRDCLTSCNKGK